MSKGQTLARTNNKPVTRIAQPGQRGHTVWGFEINVPTNFGTRYDSAAVTHTTNHVEREPKYGSRSRMRLLNFVTRACPILNQSHLTNRLQASSSAVRFALSQIDHQSILA